MQPCESAAKYKVPAIKADLARKLKNEGKSQKEIALILGVTEAAVSQYLSGKRAKSKPVKRNKTKHKAVFDICRLCGLCQLKEQNFVI
ncbi:MAG: helix-turn-helix domain-containing protein [Candidatus Nanoarchaeia archaeon]